MDCVLYLELLSCVMLFRRIPVTIVVHQSNWNIHRENTVVCSTWNCPYTAIIFIMIKNIYTFPFSILLCVSHFVLKKTESIFWAIFFSPDLIFLPNCSSHLIFFSPYLIFLSYYSPYFILSNEIIKLSFKARQFVFPVSMHADSWWRCREDRQLEREERHVILWEAVQPADRLCGRALSTILEPGGPRFLQLRPLHVSIAAGKNAVGGGNRNTHGRW